MILWMKSKNKQDSELYQWKCLKTWPKYRTLNSCFTQSSSHALICSAVAGRVEEGCCRLQAYTVPSSYSPLIKTGCPGCMLWSAHLFIFSHLFDSLGCSTLKKVQSPSAWLTFMRHHKGFLSPSLFPPKLFLFEYWCWPIGSTHRSHVDWWVLPVLGFKNTLT